MLLLFGFVCVFWGNLGQSFFVGWYGESIKASLGLSAQTYGMLYSAATLMSASLLMWAGGLIDVWPLKRFVVVVSLGLMLACLLFYASVNTVVLLMAFFCVRFFGQALLPLAGLTTMAKCFDQDRGKAISLASTGVSLGEVVLPLLAILLIQLLGWQASWLVFAATIPLLFIPVVLWLLSRDVWLKTHAESRDDTEEEDVKASARKTLFGDVRYWLSLPTQLSVPFMLTAIFIHQGFILNEKAWSPEWMASCFIFYGCSHWLSSIAFGILVDRFSGVKLFRLYTLPLIMTLVLVANVEGQWVVIAMMVLLGLSIGASGPVCGSMWAEVYGANIQGGIRSAAGTVVILSTAVSPIFIGWLIDNEVSLAFIFNGLAAFFLMSLVLLKFAYKHQ